MRRLFLALSLLIVSACSTPPAPVAAPETPPPPPVIEEKVTGTVHVTASALNVRSEPSFEGEILAQVKTGTELGVLREEESWVKVRLADGATGWVASRFVSDDAPSSTTKKKRAPARRNGCPPDSDYAFIDAPTPSFSENGAHGLVIVEATVNAKGIVTSTKLISNRTGDEALAFLAMREIKAARFSPPIMDCVPRAFIFTYRRTF